MTFPVKARRTPFSHAKAMLPERLEAAAQTAHEQGLISRQQYHTLKKELKSDNTH